MANNTKKTKSTKSNSAVANKPESALQAEHKAVGPNHLRKDIVTLDRRTGGDRRSGVDRRQRNAPVAVERRVLERRAKVNRRRQIDPTTCERDYTADEIEFMNALERYKRTSGRMFPTCSEILEVLRSLGYEKRPPQAAQTQFSDAQNGPGAASDGTSSAVADAVPACLATKQQDD